ncbi:MAG: hypothetical protein J3R72DRAFT_461126 [Linnemannia gamsii]|nr:MAG: hypothetical protein J3R72DRAFT_461126 [Linnemannia gamsii]
MDTTEVAAAYTSPHHHQDTNEANDIQEDNGGETLVPQQPTTTPSGAPMPTTTDPALIEAWDRCWTIVKASPGEFDVWEELMRLADRQDGGFTPDAPPANIANVRVLYDAFLEKFPLCFGYWKKYSDLEFLSRGAEGAIEIFERGVKGIANSVDLWVQYCTFIMEYKADDREQVEQLFERGAKCVGLDFMPHVFWEKFIAFYEEKEEYSKLFQLMERVIKIPMHQYARFYQQYVQLVSSRPMNEVLSEEQYSTYKAKVTAAVADSQEAEVSEEQLEAEIRRLVIDASGLIYARTAEETNKRWPYEAEIKRPYFHVKPMDMPQLSNWRRYLDFEETEGDVERIRVLYERCLVTCALYEEFWLRYGAWARSLGDLDHLQDIYSRAVVMVPSSNPSLALTLAMIEEERGDNEGARRQYQNTLERLPGHIETIVRFANFERRISPNDLAAAELVYASQLGLDNVDEMTQTSIVTLYAKFLWQVRKDVDGARAIFKTGEGKFDSRFYFSNYLKFEMDQQGDDYEKRVSAVFEQVRYSGLPEGIRNDYGQAYLDFVMEFGSSAGRYNQLEADIKAPSVYVAQSRKRAAAATEYAEEEEERSKRQRPEQEQEEEEEKKDVAMDGHGQTQAPSEETEKDGAPSEAVSASHSNAEWAGPASGYTYPHATGAQWEQQA